MLRSIFINLQSRKSKIFLWCLAVLAILLFSRVVTKYIWAYKSIIATTPATKSTNTALQTIEESYNSSHSLSKLKMYEISNFDENIRLNNGERADFAVISPGTVIPNGFEVIASLNEEKVVLLSHKGNHFGQLKDIRNSTVNIVKMNDYSEGVLRKLFDLFEVIDQRNKIGIVSSDNFLESKILPNRTVYAFFLNPLSSTSTSMFKTKIQRLRGKFDIIEVDLAELADYSHLFFSSIIKKGELSIHPLLPDEDIDTVSAFTYLVARTSVNEEVIYRILTFLNTSKKLVFDKVSRDVFINIEGISESKNIAFHRGYKKFLYGENEWFFQKNSDLIYLSGVILTAIFSFIYSNYREKKIESDESYIGILELFEDLERSLNRDLTGADNQQFLKAKNALCELIVHRSNERNILTNALIGFMVLINIMNLFRKNDNSV